VRRKTNTVTINHVPVGSDHPIVIQSMTNTDTADVKETVEQIISLFSAGSELVRITVNNEKSAKSVPAIINSLEKKNIKVPVIGDFHYNGHLLLSKYPECAEGLAKYRINPGNVGTGARDKNFTTIIEQAIKYDKPVRIGVNWGSLDQQLLKEMIDKNRVKEKPMAANDVYIHAMVESALRSAKMAGNIGLASDKIIVSAKISGVQDLVHANRLLAKKCDYPIHAGLTEAGTGNKGIISSTAGLAILLQEGIGDTIRVSLTPTHKNDRTEEVFVAQQILQSLQLRNFSPQVISCPGCGRTTSSLFQKLAADITSYIQKRIPEWRNKYPGIEDMKIAVMGCVVNGPGESRHADIGISLPGRGEKPNAPVYIEGNLKHIIKDNRLTEEFKRILEDYIKTRYGKNKLTTKAQRH
jgi:(E)-4-hydroxy-3-methylbut-2-enyl-diphosphate synthase